MCLGPAGKEIVTNYQLLYTFLIAQVIRFESYAM